MATGCARKISMGSQSSFPAVLVLRTASQVGVRRLIPDTLRMTTPDVPIERRKPAGSASVKFQLPIPLALLVLVQFRISRMSSHH